MPTLNVLARLQNVTDGWSIGRPFTVTTVGEHKQMAEPQVGTSEESVVTIASDITGGSGPGWMRIRNHGPTNYIQWGISTGVYPGKVLAGEEITMRLDAAVTALYLKANTAACRVEILIYEA